MIKIVNKRHGTPPGSVYVGRPSLLGNPFRIGVDGNRSEVIEKYRSWLELQLDDPESEVSIQFNCLVTSVLKGKDLILVCWCAPLQCHAEVIKEQIEATILDSPI